MLLSNTKIKEALEDGRLVIDHLEVSVRFNIREFHAVSDHSSSGPEISDCHQIWRR